MRRAWIGLFLGLSFRAAAAELAPGVELLPGSFVQGSQPDGNTEIFTTPQGLIVVDTGRHPQHTQGILDFAARVHLPILAVINTHWHLDHVGGNPKLRGEFPKLRVYASTAIQGALKGFLAEYRAYLEDELKKKEGDAEAQKPLRSELGILDAGTALAPDEPITQAGARDIAGKRLELGLESHAATEADVWIRDPATGVLVAGDLVTLPAPFLDTACPKGWRLALEHLAQADFQVLVPGHGPPMTRAEFESYQAAFGRLLDCAASSATKEDCIAGWLKDTGPLVPEADRELARSLLDYYLDTSLRADTSKLCGAS